MRAGQCGAPIGAKASEPPHVLAVAHEPPSDATGRQESTQPMASMTRPYSLFMDRLQAKRPQWPADRRGRMKLFVDEAWTILAATGVSWIGFYLHEAGDELVLGPRRDKPACSPIGMHGVCGEGYLTKKAIVVKDVAERGPEYIACDPRDRSEVVVPLLEPNGACWGVLDVDSHDLGSFDEHDVAELTSALREMGLTY